MTHISDFHEMCAAIEFRVVFLILQFWFFECCVSCLYNCRNLCLATYFKLCSTIFKRAMMWVIIIYLDDVIMSVRWRELTWLCWFSLVLQLTSSFQVSFVCYVTFFSCSYSTIPELYVVDIPPTGWPRSYRKTVL